MNRRELLKSAAGVTAAAALRRTGWAGVLASAPGRAALTARLARDPMRPRFHLLPQKNWMNDPNGPIYFNGNYHMFFQYDPLAPVWGDMSWNHAVSPDMIHWRHLPLALTPTPGGPDAAGCFSGSAIAVGERVYVVYTGVVRAPASDATINDGVNLFRESQCLAWSDDPMLVRWTKDPEPVVARPPQGMKCTGFRDPSAWPSRDGYYMTVGSGEENVGGCVLLYRSKDLRHWEYLHQLTSGRWDGNKTTNPCDDGEMWECPELFPLDGSPEADHVLIYSTMGRTMWASGVLDKTTMTFLPKKKGELDWGAFYAPKTQLDALGRRILWGWIPERRDEAAMRAAGWSGMMSLPRVLSLNADGTLRMRELPELATLRAGEIACLAGEQGLTVTLPRATGEVICTGAPRRAFTFTMRAGDAELLKVTYEPKSQVLHADEREIALEAGERPVLHAYVDGSVVELILAERVGYTKRFYTAQSVAPDIVAPDIVVVAQGAERMAAWRVKAISDDRLTS